MVRRSYRTKAMKDEYSPDLIEYLRAYQYTESYYRPGEALRNRLVLDMHLAGLTRKEIKEMKWSEIDRKNLPQSLMPNLLRWKECQQDILSRESARRNAEIIYDGQVITRTHVLEKWLFGISDNHLSDIIHEPLDKWMITPNDLPFLKLHLPVYKDSFDGLVAIADPAEGRRRYHVHAIHRRRCPAFDVAIRLGGFCQPDV
jgi:hypothetical protein